MKYFVIFDNSETLNYIAEVIQLNYNDLWDEKIARYFPSAIRLIFLYCKVFLSWSTTEFFVVGLSMRVSSSSYL